MKPYLVVRVAEAADEFSFRFRSEMRTDHTVYVAQEQQKSDNRDGWQRPEQCVFEFDTEADANAFAEVAAKKWPQNRYVTAHVHNVYQPIVSEIRKSSFSEKGLLPT